MTYIIKKSISLTPYHQIDVKLEYKEGRNEKNWENLEEIENYFTFSASCHYKRGRDEYWGQALDEFIKDETLIKSEHYKTFLSIYRFWKMYHLNDINAGTKEQTEYLESIKFDMSASNLDAINQELEKMGLQKEYKYGNRWLLNVIHEVDIKEILESIFDVKHYYSSNRKKLLQDYFTKV